ncbi:MAG: MerR family transcriptional regulator [Flavobacteriales bacterium]|nr:MerR family transcriptional regulator [Flavobacteriales bacterium]MBK9075998.1 MerR family transcriptional regulator [Flavobacteriales bacterium]
MTTEELISLELFCSHQGVEIAFVHALHERGLLQITVVQDRSFVAPEVLPHIEKLARMHYEMDINLEGIEAISHLLERVERLQSDMRAMHERLRLYEEG